MTGKKWIVLFLLPVSLLLSSCGYKDLDRRFFATVIGVDKSDNPKKPYKVSLKLVITSPKVSPGQEKFQVSSAEGHTVGEAIHLIKSQVDKELDFAHTNIIVIGKDLAKQDIATPLDWFNRRRDIQRVAYMAVGSPSAEDVLKLKYPSERFAGNALILSLSHQGTDTAFISKEYLFDFTRRMLQNGLDGYMPYVVVGKDTYIIRKTAIFDKNHMVLTLSSDETRLLNEVIGKKTSRLVFAVKKGKIDFAYNVDSVNIQYAIITDGPKPFIDFRVKFTGTIEDSNQPLVSTDKISQLEQVGEEVCRKRFKNLLEKLRDHNVDPIGFGLRYQATRFHEDQDWTEWKKLYPDIEFKVSVKLSISGPGVMR